LTLIILKDHTNARKRKFPARNGNGTFVQRKYLNTEVQNKKKRTFIKLTYPSLNPTPIPNPFVKYFFKFRFFNRPKVISKSVDFNKKHSLITYFLMVRKPFINSKILIVKVLISIYREERERKVS